jgi:CheY-like chemotaxis protein
LLAMSQPSSGAETPPGFVSQVGEALRHLYDPSALVRSPLADLLGISAGTDQRQAADRRSQRLRALLLETIESLNPGPGISFRSLSARSYQALHLHYVEGHTVEEVGRLLSLSLRQAYRDIRKGESDLATLLWERCLAEERRSELSTAPALAGFASASRQFVSDQGAVLREEIERLPSYPVNTSLQQALDQAAESLLALAGRVGVSLSLQLEQDCLVRADPSALRQCLTAMLSCAVQSCKRAEPGDRPGCSAQVVALADRRPSQGRSVELRLSCRPVGQAALSGQGNLLSLARTLASALGGAEFAATVEGGEVQLRLRLQAALTPMLMVIDDNEGLPELFRRYLSDSDWSVVGVADASEGLRLAKEHPPSAIVLDILMPVIDGWALLSQLKSDPLTADVPVIVCSVFNDPELALSLGAAMCIPKPVSQSTLLAALRRVRAG